MRVLGIYREKNLAGKPESDNRIADAVASSLLRNPLVEQVEMRKGEKLTCIREGPLPALVFSMARSSKALMELAHLSLRKVPVVNSAYAVSACHRRRSLYDSLLKMGIPVPQTRIMGRLDVIAQVPPFVIKRLTTHGKSQDTLVISSREDLEAAAGMLRERTDDEYLVQKFIQGRHFKFYGVGKDIFPLEFPAAATSGKVAELVDYARAIADYLDLEVYGGDFIYASDGQLVFVDVNDWPSFSPVREEAAQKIADLLAAKLEERS